MIRRVLAGPLVALALLVAGGCGDAPPPEWHAADGHRWRELRVDKDGGAGFTAIDPSESGIKSSNDLGVEQALENEHLLIGSGVAVGDVDGDDLPDVYLSRLEGPNRLYRNRGGWRFEDVTDSASVAADGRFSTGATMADLDGDGDLDLLVTSLGGPDVAFQNDGRGRFEEVDVGLEGGLGSTTTTLADVDGDGDLDLYRATYKAESASDVLGLYERSRSEMETMITRRSGDSVVIAPEFRDHFRMEERGGEVEPVEQADPDRLYLNDGSGRFEAVPWTDGAFLDEDGRRLPRPIDDFGLAARFHDVDRDGDPDLYVCNDFSDPDRLWINDGDGTFRAAPALALRTTSHASMSVDFADVDRDGRTDFFVAEMRARDVRRRLLEEPFHGPYRKPAGTIRDRPQVQRNTLFLNRGDGSFAEIGRLAGVDASDWSWTSMFLDVDLDGWEDLLVANGYSRDTQNGDVRARIAELRGHADTRELKRLLPEYPNRNVAFRNRGDLTFRDTGVEWGFGTEPDISHGMAAGDLDGDGDLDLVINRLGTPARVLRNDAGGGRVAVRLRGRPPNTQGVGARVRLVGGPGGPQEKEMTAGGLYLSSSDYQLTFASGRADSLALEVDWPGGGRSVIDGVRPDRLYEVHEPPAGRGGGAAASDGGGTGDGRDAGRGDDRGPRPLFVDATDRLDHRHAESSFHDFRLQLLLPYRPGRLGPGVSWADVDEDGDPDLVVPPGGGGRLVWLRNDGGSFTEVPFADSASDLDLTAAVPLPGPDGRPTLVVGQSSFEAETENRLRSASAALRLDPSSVADGVDSLPPNDLAATGPLAVADVDGDRDLDLFLGGRVLNRGYPLPAPSLLFRNEEGRLQPDRRNAVLLAEIGMVSGAVFSDVDADGDPDLLLALEWGPIRLLLNEDGRFVDRTSEWGLGRLTGRWNGVTTGDLDGDGRMDAVVTGWGRNLRPRPSPERPFVLFTRDFDRNGTWDFLLTVVSGDGESFVPLEPYYRFRTAVPSVRSRLPTYEAYSRASLEEVLGIPPVEAYRLTARRYDHLVLLNRDGRFEPVPLPLRAQFAPATGVAVGDLDGDGHEDLFLAQNFFPMAPDESRQAAGLGLVLLGDGTGRLEPMSAAASGIRIWGDQRGAALADYDGDGRVDLAVAQNGAATRLYRNAGGRSGLRVRLVGPEANPAGYGAVLRVVYADGTKGPARELHGGSGYWSLDGAVPVLGLRSEPEAVEVRWPGGVEGRIVVLPGARTVTVRYPAP